MFAIDCPVHGHQVLVPPTRIRGLHNTDQGILVTVECWCGAPVQVRTGRPRQARPITGSLSRQPPTGARPLSRSPQ